MFNQKVFLHCSSLKFQIMKIARFISLFLCSISLISTINATNITIGTGALLNTPTTYPAPYGNWYWGAKHQFLIQASELTAAGMSAGNINSLSFNVKKIVPII